MKKILLIDNYDSFTYNLYYLLQQNYSGLVEVIRNDKINIRKVSFYDAIVISPGPGKPEDSGLSMEILKLFHQTHPILGICLGMQCINEFFAGKTIKAPYPVHGKQDVIKLISPSLLLEGLIEPVRVARYHSLIISGISSVLEVKAITNDDLPMVIEHKTLQIYGIQFHPESFMTPQGNKMIVNFLKTLEKE